MCDGASCESSGTQKHSLGACEKQRNHCMKVSSSICVAPKHEVCTNIPECRLQMVNLVISQQLGENGKEHNGFIKKDVCCTKLGCVSDETVCLCCAMPCVRHPILFCVREGLQLHFFLFFCLWLLCRG